MTRPISRVASLIGILIVASLFVSTACRQRSERSQISTDGFWLSHLGEIKEFSPCGDGQYAWGILAEDGTLNLWRRFGTFVSEKKFSDLGEVLHIWPLRLRNTFGTWVELRNGSIFLITIQSDPDKNKPLLDKVSIRQLKSHWQEPFVRAIIPSLDGRYAWIVSAAGNSLYLVDTLKDGTLEAGNPLLDNMVGEAVYPTTGRNQAWVSLAPNHGLYFIDTNRTVFDVSKKLAPDAVVGWAFPLEDGSRAWLDLRDRQHRPSSDTALTQRYDELDKSFHNPNAYLVDRSGNVIGVSQLLFNGKPIKYSSMGLDDSHKVWIVTKEHPGVFLISVTHDGLRVIKQFLQDWNFERVYASKDGTRAVAVASGSRRLFYMNANGEEQQLLNLPPEEGLISIVSLSSDSRFAWIGLSKRQKPFLLVIIALEVPKSPTITKAYFEESIMQVYPLPGDTHACVVTNSSSEEAITIDRQNNIYLLDNEGNKLNQGHALKSNTELLVPWYDSDHLWIGTGSGLTFNDAEKHEISALGTKDYVESASITFDGQATLKYSRTRMEEAKNPFHLVLRDKIEEAKVDVEFPNGVLPRDVNCKARLVLADEENGATAYESAKLDNLERSSLQLNWRPKWDHSYDIILQLEDTFGSHYNIKWRSVYFVRPITDAEWFRSIILTLAITISVVTVVHLIPDGSPFFRRWLPAAFVVVSGAGSAAWRDALRVDTSLLFLLLPVTLLAVLAISTVKPSLFIRLAPSEPFHRVVPYLLHFSFVRRAVFTPYAMLLKRRIEDDRYLANNEIYVERPAEVREGSAQRLLAQPSMELLSYLTTQYTTGNALIESPGGRGKSALLREVIVRAVDGFVEEPQSPLPVLCEPKGKSIEDMISLALGKYKISASILAEELLSGRFFAVIDGLSDGEVEPNTLVEFIRGRSGQLTHLLLASRPNDAFREAVKSSEEFLIIEPLRLNDETYATFEEAYYRNDKRLGDYHSSRLTPEVKRICRGIDGTYLPILVRLAMRLGGNEVTSVGDLYEATFERLLRSKERSATTDLLDQTVEFCLNTYWKNGQRKIRYSASDRKRADIIERLLIAGILVSADRTTQQVDSPRSRILRAKEVRFFHDSMQSYLTARGLVANEETWGAVLQRAAADPLFRSTPFERPAACISEIFQMCLEVFRPASLLRSVLIRELEEWANERYAGISKQDITDGLPDGLKSQLEMDVSPDQGSRIILLAVISLCAKADGDDGFHNLGQLFARIACALHQ